MSESPTCGLGDLLCKNKSRTYCVRVHDMEVSSAEDEKNASSLCNIFALVILRCHVFCSSLEL